MTGISINSEKKEKAENLQKLIQSSVTSESQPNSDVEKGLSGKLPRLKSQLIIVRPRFRKNASLNVAISLLAVLCVMSAALFVGLYAYQRYTQSKMLNLRGWCRIPYEFNPENTPLTDVRHAMQEMIDNGNFLNEEFEIESFEASYEKITVPTFKGGRNSRFLHDFSTNITGIVDVESRRCFVMPLNRTQVLPPKDLIDIVQKMWKGYYQVDMAAVKENMRVMLPPDGQPESIYIRNECKNFPIYRLEKIKAGVAAERYAERNAKKMAKRSAKKEPVVYTHYPGKQILEMSIVNEDELNAYEAEHNHP